MVIIFIHGIFGNYEETWQSTPLQLMTVPIFSQADFGSFGYDSKVLDFRSPELMRDQLLLWIRTHLKDYEQIYFIAHSMGGLIVRDACSALVSSSEEDRRLFSKIRRCFMVAVPLSGAKLAKFLNHVPLLNRINSRIKYLARSEDAVKSYENTIQEAEKHSILRPQFSWFVGGNDRLVKKATNSAFTKDDHYEGVLPGTHESIKLDQDANSTLIQRIIQLINSDDRGDSASQKSRLDLQARLSKTTQAKPSGTTAMSAKGRRDLILLSCSASKSDKDQEQHPGTGGITEDVADPAVGLLAIKTRVQIMNLIGMGRLNGTEFKEGNRIARPENQALILGPDFGGRRNDVRYLPAYKRYIGRTYQATSEQWQQFMAHSEDDRPSILIMSGLYGLVPMDEYIQKYDCHITDTDQQTGQIVRDYWKQVMTDILISHLEALEEKWQVGRIVELLSERSYQEAIDWQRIYPRWSVLHRTFEKAAGRDALENLGIFVKEIIQDPSRVKEIVPDTFYGFPQFLNEDRIAFESRLYESKLPVARE